jgi:hypothetical protein
VRRNSPSKELKELMVKAERKGERAGDETLKRDKWNLPFEGEEHGQ